LSQWPEAEEAQLRKDTRNAYITVNFAEDLDTRGRADAFRAIQSVLLGDRDYKGEITADSIKNPNGFESAKVGRYAVIADGPHFQAPSGSFWSRPQVEKIVEKLTDKTYAPKAPLELFAYSPYNEPDGAVGSIEEVQAAITKHLPGSQFRRVHVFHLGFLKHVCSMPP
jgi:hypothetical protein